MYTHGKHADAGTITVMHVVELVLASESYVFLEKLLQDEWCMMLSLMLFYMHEANVHIRLIDLSCYRYCCRDLSPSTGRGESFTVMRSSAYSFPRSVVPTHAESSRHKAGHAAFTLK